VPFWGTESTSDHARSVPELELSTKQTIEGPDPDHFRSSGRDIAKGVPDVIVGVQGRQPVGIGTNKSEFAASYGVRKPSQEEIWLGGPAVDNEGSTICLHEGVRVSLGPDS